MNEERERERVFVSSNWANWSGFRGEFRGCFVRRVFRVDYSDGRLLGNGYKLIRVEVGLNNFFL